MAGVSARATAGDGDGDDTQPAPAFSSPAALRAWLLERGVTQDGWGSGAAKSVDDLYEEVKAGESALFETGAAAAAATAASRRALRRVDVVSLTLSCPPAPGLVLVEASQVLPDGRVRRRGMMPLSEKMRAGEDWRAAARRGVREELGSLAATKLTAEATKGDTDSPGLVALDEASHSLDVGPVRDALSYPGLPAAYAVHRARGALSPEAFAAVLPAALLLSRSRRRQAGQGEGRRRQDDEEEEEMSALEFETVEEVAGKGTHRTRWRWVEEERGAAGEGEGAAAAAAAAAR
jgi:hypothetical protein